MMKRLLAGLTASLFYASAFAANAPDTSLLTGPNFQQVPAGSILVTPSGGSQQTLAAALSSSGGCTTNCTFTGTTTTPFLNASSTAGTPPIQIAGTGVLNLIANQTSPIVPGANNITYGPTGLYVPSPIDLGYAETITSSTQGTYLSNITDNVTVTGTMPNHWGELTIYQSILPGSGSLTGEVNIQSNVLVIGSGDSYATGGGYESALNNNGSITGTGANWKGFYTVANNGAAGVNTGKMLGFVDIWSNANTTAGTVAAHIAFQCNTNSAGGSVPSVNECMQNNDASQAIVTLGQVNVGSYLIPASSVALKVNGTATYTLPFQVVTSGNIIGLMARDTGEVDMEGATVVLGIAGTTTATMTVASSDAGNNIYLTGGSGGSGSSLNITGTLPTGTAATYACFTSGGKLISSSTAC